MKVSISVPGTFHAFRLGEQLSERQALDTIYSTHPKFAIETTVNDEHIHSIRHPEALSRICTYLPKIGDNHQCTRWKASLFDRAVARNLSGIEIDLFVGFAGSTIRSLRQAKAVDAIPVVERCSSHIRTQSEILQSEFERFNIDQTPVPEEVIQREEKEYEEAVRIITPSTFVYRSFLNQGVSEEKLICVPFGVDETKYKPPGPNEGRHTDETLRFLYAGRVGIRKGIPYLLQAWESTDLQNAELHIAGPAELSGDRFIDEYANFDSIEFHGWVDDIESLYTYCDVFVLPTLEEGSAYVTYEAMACGMPVITTPHSGWVGEDGIHGIEVPIRSSDALEDAMMKMNDDMKRQMGNNAREHITRNYTWEHYGDRIYERYRAIMNEYL